jgi:hypothetical protein
MASDYYNIIFKHFLNIRMQYLRNNSWQPYICAHLTMGWAWHFQLNQTKNGKSSVIFVCSIIY